MMKKVNLFICAAAMILVSACNNQSDNNMETSQDKAILLSDLDTSVDPCDNFFQYANGGWMKDNPLPADKSRYGSFDKLADEGEKQVMDLVKDLAAKKETLDGIGKKIGFFYSVGMDSVKIQQQGAEPLSKVFGKIDEISNNNQVQKFIAHMHARNVFPLFRLYADADAKNSNMIIAQLTQGGLGLPDRDYYTENDERSVFLRGEYVKHVAKMFMLLGDDEKTAGKNADIVMKIEARLANASMTRLDCRDPFKTYNKVTPEKLMQHTKNINWPAYFKGIGLPDPGEINVGMPEFFREVDKMIAEVPVNEWKIYLRWNVINNTADYLSDDFVSEHFNFYGKTLSGSPENRPRWKRVLSVTNRSLSEAIGQMYVEKYFPPEAKERMVKLVANLKEAYGDRIRNLTWMSDSTKQKALEKLEKINVKVGYPDKWRDYSGLEVGEESYVMNVLLANSFEFSYMISKINKPVDRQEWHMPPQMVNAYYDPSMNEVVFPAAILQPPFFFMDADDAVNYGAIGVVIGHEMTHGFDDQGRNYDKEGNLNDWWSAEDAEKFNSLTAMLVEQFNSFIVLDTLHANGNLTLGENIADLGGLNISYSAFQKVLKEKPGNEKINGFTPEQRFFLAYAHVWAQNIRNEEILRRTREDVHSLGINRVNGPLPNLPEFYEAFGIKEGSSMWLPEDKRAIIW